MFDGLIRVEASLPSRTLVDTGAAGDTLLILLARRAEEHRQALFELLDGSTGDGAWEMTARLLMTLGTPRAVARVAEELRCDVEVVVGDTEGGRTVRSSRGVACGPLPRPEGFPPPPRYRPGAVVLAGGPLPVYVRRYEPTGMVCRPFREDPGSSRARLSAKLLSLLAGDGVEPAPRTYRLVSIAYESDEAYVAEAERVVAEIRAGHAALLDRLVERGHLTAEERAGLAPPIELEVEDLRADRTRALPPVRQGG